MTDQHPITPPPELVQEWINLPLSTGEIIAIAWRHGADQELEACCEWLPSDLTIDGESLRDVRRPKPPSLKQQALDQLAFIEDRYGHLNTDYIRRALERLQQLENNQ